MDITLLAIQPGDIDKSWLVEYAARACRHSEMSTTKNERLEFLRKRVDGGELSIFEHARFCEFVGDIDTPIMIDEDYEDREGYFIHSYNARHAIERGAYDLVELLTAYDQIPMRGLTPAQRLRHACATFEISGISRVCSHQLVRHRLASYSQESQRHCDVADGWVVPPSIASNEAARYVYLDALAVIEDAAEELLHLGIPQEDARFIYAQAAPTRIITTRRFCWWRDFIEKRAMDAAQWEIRSVATEVQRQLAEIDPEIFA